MPTEKNGPDHQPQQPEPGQYLSTEGGREFNPAEGVFGHTADQGQPLPSDITPQVENENDKPSESER